MESVVATQCNRTACACVAAALGSRTSAYITAGAGPGPEAGHCSRDTAAFVSPDHA